MQRKNLVAIILAVFANMVGFSMVLPLLSYYAKAYAASPAVTGLIVGSYAAGQFIGAPGLGRLSDSRGRRRLLILSLIGALVSFILFALADPAGRALASLISESPSTRVVNSSIIGILFASRILGGLMGGNIAVAQAYISDVTDVHHRAQSLAWLGAAFALGIILGPVIVGLVNALGIWAPGGVVAAITLVSLLLVLVWLPESLTEERCAELERHPRAAFTLGNLLHALSLPRVGPLLIIRLVFGLTFNLFTTIFPLYGALHLGMSIGAISLVLAYVAVVAVTVQLLAIAPLTRRYSDRVLILASVIGGGASLLGWALVASLAVLVVVITLLSVSGNILATVLTSALSKSVYPEQIGGTLGLAASFESLTRAVAPPISAALLQGVGVWAPGVFGALIMVWLTWYTVRKLITRPDEPIPLRPDDTPTH